jgi:hypothetical protein
MVASASPGPGGFAAELASLVIGGRTTRPARRRDDCWQVRQATTSRTGEPLNHELLAASALRAERERLPLGSHPVSHGGGLIDAGVQGVMRIATSYFVTEDRWPGVSPAGIAFSTSSPRL